MNTVGNDVATYLVMQQAPGNWPGRSVMHWRHGIHEVGHVPCACCESFVQHFEISARVTEGNNPTAIDQLFGQPNASTYFRRQCHQMFQCRTIERGQREGSVGSQREARELARLFVVALPGFHVMVRSGVDRSRLEDALQVLLANLD